MLNFAEPIALILIAGGSSSERQMLKESARKEEYVFVEADKIYKCMDIAECHHPQCLLLYFSLIEDNHLVVVQFLQFLDIPIILITNNVSETQRQYFFDIGIFAVIQGNNNVFELRHNLEISLKLTKEKKLKQREINFNFDVGEMKTYKTIPLQDIINNAIETAINIMSEMIGCEIQSQLPYSEALPPVMLSHKLRNMLGERIVTVAQLDFTGDFAGCAQILFSAEAADALLLALGGDDLPVNERSQFKADMMAEIGNVAINSVIGTLSNTLNYRVNYVVPVYKEGLVDEMVDIMIFNFNSTVILSRTHFHIQDLEVEGDFFLFFQARLLLDMLFCT